MKLISITLAAAALAFAVHAQAQGQFEDLTEEQAVQLANEATLRDMGGDLSTERAMYLSTILSSPAVIESLERDGEYMIDAAGVSLAGDYTNSGDDGISVHAGHASTIVAIIVCPKFDALEPHKGSGRGTGGIGVTKAKSRAECNLVPTTQGFPPPKAHVDWTMNMVLTRRTFVALGPIHHWLHLPVAWASHDRDGTWKPRWRKDPADNHTGTQVLMGVCLNGQFRNISTIWIDVPYPYYVSGFGFIGVRINQNDVTAC